MTDSDELSRLQREAALERLRTIRSYLESVEENPHVKQYAAAEYVSDATESVEAAIIDVRDSEIRGGEDDGGK